MILVLAWAAGSLDAIGYLGLGQVFTANMTGNAVLLGLALGRGEGLAALRSVVALGGYALGVAIGATILSKDRERMDWPPSVTNAVFLEGIVLATFTIAWHALGVPRPEEWVYGLIALSAVAMGIQSAAVRRLNVPGIVTTYITGTLTSLVSGLTRRIRQAEAGSAPGASEREAVGASSPVINWERRVGLQAGVFLMYILAASLSGLAQTRAPSVATIAPVLAVLLVAIAARTRGRQGAPAASRVG